MGDLRLKRFGGKCARKCRIRAGLEHTYVSEICNLVGNQSLSLLVYSFKLEVSAGRHHKHPLPKPRSWKQGLFNEHKGKSANDSSHLQDTPGAGLVYRGSAAYPVAFQSGRSHIHFQAIVQSCIQTHLPHHTTTTSTIPLLQWSGLHPCHSSLQLIVAGNPASWAAVCPSWPQVPP